MNSNLTAEDYAILYRFSVALAGVNEEAEQLVHDVLEEKLTRAADLPPQKALLELLKAIWQQKPEPAGDAPISNLPPQFQWMKTRDRAVNTLGGFGRFSDLEIESICGDNGTPGTLPDKIAMLPEKLAATLESIVVSPELLKRFAVTAQGIHPPFRLVSPLGIALLFAAIVSVTVIFWVWRDWHSKADEILAHKFLDAAVGMPPEKLEPVDATIAEVSDTLYLKYGLENYPIPPAFAGIRASRLGVGRIDGHPVVQIQLRDSGALLMLFRGEDFGLGSDYDWQTASIAGWSLAMRTENQQGQVLTLKGTEEQLRSVFPK